MDKRRVVWGLVFAAAAQPIALAAPPSTAGTVTADSPMQLARCGAMAAPYVEAVVIGGTDVEGTLRSAEMWTPSRAGWSDAGKLARARAGATATALADRSVLVIGGANERGELVRVAELGPEKWADAGSLAAGRVAHTATLLADGKSVLVIGGVDAKNRPLDDVELWRDGHFSKLGKLAVARRGHTATLLPDGRVLVAGGELPGKDDFTSIATVEIYDPTTGHTHAAPDMLHARAGHTATALADGRVLVTGGRDAAQDQTATAEIFDPRSGTWLAAHALATGRQDHAAIRLRDGRVLIAGGLGLACYSKGCEHNMIGSLELWDPARDTWSPAGALATAVSDPGLVLLGDGRVLIAGGTRWTGCSASTEIWASKI